MKNQRVQVPALEEEGGKVGPLEETATDTMGLKG
jgi:hypothetical protein